MKTSQNAKSGSIFVQQIGTINMSQYQRDRVLHSARIAEVFVDAIMWIRDKFEGPSADRFAKPNLNY